MALCVLTLQSHGAEPPLEVTFPLLLLLGEL